MEYVDDIEIEDFELKNAEYHTRMQVYGKAGTLLGAQSCYVHKDPEQAIFSAKSKAIEMEEILKTCTYLWEGKTVAAAEIVVETVIWVDDEAIDAGIIFRRPVLDNIGQD